MPGLKTILIHTEDIIPGAKKMIDSQGRYDLLAQILYTGYNIKIHDHSTSPADQQTLISPFTTSVRGKVHCTPLCLKILRNASLSAKQQLDEANDLLEPYDIYLERA